MTTPGSTNGRKAHPSRIAAASASDEGGYHHCQIDNQSICVTYMWDWLEEILEPAPSAHAGDPREGQILVDKVAHA